MREIAFRGKRKNTGEWVYGNYDPAPEKEIWIKGTVHGTWRIFSVIPETVGQYTGEKDSNGVKIFEGDIVQFGDYDDPWVGVVEFTEGAFLVELDWRNNLTSSEWKVIGNIHDNPELVNRE